MPLVDEDRGTRYPAYVAYPTFKNFLAKLKESGLPSQIDKSVMQGFSGGTQSHLMSSLRFLELVKEGAPSNALEQLVDSVGTDDWPDVLGAVLKESYANLVGNIDLEKATPNQLDKLFEARKLTGVMLDKSVRFFLAAMADANQPISVHLTNRKPKATRKRSLEKSTRPKPTDKSNANSIAPGASAGHDEIEYPIHLPRGRIGRITLPRDLDDMDCEILELQFAVIRKLASSKPD